MNKVFIFFWCMAGLLTLDVVLRTPRHWPARANGAVPAVPAVPAVRADASPVVRALQTRCELPAGTVVFVVRERVP